MSTHKIKGEDYYQCRDVKAERDKLLEEVAELRDSLEAAEKKHNALCAELLDAKKTTRELFHNANVANMTITTLQAKIAEMENQKPVAWISSRNGFIVKENKNPDYNLPLIHAPGAKGE